MVQQHEDPLFQHMMGIISMENVCFFNSICQVLYSLTEFWRYVVDDEDHLALFPNYSIYGCSIREWHHINAKHLFSPRLASYQW